MIKKITKARPFLQWVGGKKRVLNEILKYVPESIENYYEPFLGGGVVFFELEDRIKETAFLSDYNKKLIDSYKSIKDLGIKYIEIWLSLKDTSKENYLRSRDKFNRHYKGELVYFPKREGLEFIYLNKCCFNALYRENKSGEFNVSYGTPNEIINYDFDNIVCVKKALEKAYIEHKSISDFNIDLPTIKDFVYLDPPYIPVSSTSNFTDYVAGGFNLELHKHTAFIFNELKAKGVPVIASNNYTELTKELYKGTVLEIKENKVSEALII